MLQVRAAMLGAYPGMFEWFFRTVE